MGRPMVEKGLQVSRRSVRFVAKWSLTEIKKSKNNGFGREVITHASRPEGLAKLYVLFVYSLIFTFSFVDDVLTATYSNTSIEKRKGVLQNTSAAKP